MSNEWSKARYLQIPILVAEEDGKTGLKAWCPFCHMYHYHGKPEGHRIAHCVNPRSPFNQTGYFIVLKKHLPRKSLASCDFDKAPNQIPFPF
jgi:hypothetical protein